MPKTFDSELRKEIEHLVFDGVMDTWNKDFDDTIINIKSLISKYAKKKGSFEDYLMEKHAEQYIGTKDCMIDDFNVWVCDLGVDDLIEYGEKYRAELFREMNIEEK